ncbi:MAG TPA: MBOAT family protein [Nitrospirota bacterium]|nr:MBOAT family protein [Nitrospirota bacterium]
MLFNSFEFILFFLPLSLIVYFSLNKRKLTRAAKAWLVFASLLFYSWWNIKYLPLLLASACFNYAVGTSFLKISGSQRKLILFVGIGSNIALLAYFKYSNFFLLNLDRFWGLHSEPYRFVLPLGISFFTLTQIAYLIDSYNNAAKEYDFLNYVLFVSFFPHLLAGPIIHHKEMMPQFDASRKKVLNYKNLSSGICLFLIGLFKKVVVADTFARYANIGFDTATNLTLIDAWMTSLSFTFQLYFDFSGYSDMALGSAMMFNIHLPVNFNSPYKALNIQDFWRRWHMTLSRFLRDYIYIPLGGNRVPELLIVSNLMITFLIGGLWHGAGWHFILWGCLHGLAMVICRLWSKLNVPIPKVIAWFITFNFVNVAWIFFRAKEWTDATKVLKGMFGLSGFQFLDYGLKIIHSYVQEFGMALGTLYTLLENANNVLLWTIIGLVIIVLAKNSNELARTLSPSARTSFLTALLLFLGLLNLFIEASPTEFLYFNF